MLLPPTRAILESSLFQQGRKNLCFRFTISTSLKARQEEIKGVEGTINKISNTEVLWRKRNHNFGAKGLLTVKCWWFWCLRHFIRVKCMQVWNVASRGILDHEDCGLNPPVLRTPHCRIAIALFFFAQVNPGYNFYNLSIFEFGTIYLFMDIGEGKARSILDNSKITGWLKRYECTYAFWALVLGRYHNKI